MVRGEDPQTSNYTGSKPNDRSTLRYRPARIRRTRGT